MADKFDLFVNAIKNVGVNKRRGYSDPNADSPFSSSPKDTSGYNDEDLLKSILASDSGFNNIDSNFADVLGRLSSTGATSDPIYKLLYILGINQSDALSGSQRDDWNKQLLDTLVQYVLTKENRHYNEYLRDEDRLYNNPTNALARLMGAGISRDAALQMLNSSTGSGGSSGVPYSQAAQAAQGIAPSQSRLNELQGKLGIAQTVFGGISSIASLVSCGMSIPQAISQNKILKNQAVLSQESLQGLNSANKVFNALGNAVTSGVISMETLNGFTNAQDALNYLYDHQDTNAFKDIFADGSYNNVLGTSFGRNSFSSLWHDFTDTKNYGKQLDLEIQRSNLQNELYSIQGRAAQRDYFFGLQSSINSLIKDNEDIAILWNDFLSGNIQLEIDNERLSQAKQLTKIGEYNQHRSERADYAESVEFDAFKNFVENGEPAEPDSSSTGQQIINYLTFTRWYDELSKNLVKMSQSPSQKHWSPDGKSYWSSSYRDDYKDFLKKNQQLVYTAAFLRSLVESNRLDSWQGDKAPVWQFLDMWNSSGANDMVTAVGETTAEIAIPFLRPAKAGTTIVNQLH